MSLKLHKEHDYSALFLLFDIPFVYSLSLITNFEVFVLISVITSPLLLIVLLFKTQPLLKFSKSTAMLFQFMTRTLLVLTFSYFYFGYGEIMTLSTFYQPSNANYMYRSEDSIFALMLVGFLSLAIWTSIVNIFKQTFMFIKKFIYIPVFLKKN